MPILKTIILGLFAASTYATSTFACPLVGGLVDFNCDGEHKISVVGDSFVFGTGDEQNGGQGGYVLRVGRTLPSTAVNNYGLPGITTAQLLSHHKQLNRGHYLIDDRTKNGAGEFEGEHIHFGTASFPDWPTVLTYLRAKESFRTGRTM